MRLFGLTPETTTAGFEVELGVREDFENSHWNLRVFHLSTWWLLRLYDQRCVRNEIKIYCQNVK